MKKLLVTLSFLFFIYLQGILSQPTADTTVFLLTCGTGTETYSIYGHSALRVVISGKHSDTVYNWGVFDFSTPNFTWKFAKGRLDYMLLAQSIESFLQIYLEEQRHVLCQKINLNSNETKQLISLINVNLKPENVNYRYDFFYDDCSTRIRDLLEKSVGRILLYPPAETGEIPTFRKMVGKYQNPFPWLQFGIDLIMGSPGDKKASFRDRMFLPIDLKNGLSETVINRDGKMIPLLQNPDVILDFNPPVLRQQFLTTPVFIFTLLLIIIIILSGWLKSGKLINLLDIIIFSGFSILALLMIFFNFFTDHQQMKWNLNIIWLNPFILICLIYIMLKKNESTWFRILFFFLVAFLVLQLILPQDFNSAIYPLVLILIVRSSIRSGFRWNPLSSEHFSPPDTGSPISKPLKTRMKA
jgi:hypothetical protein